MAVSSIIPRRRPRCVGAFSLESTGWRIDAYSPPTVLSRSTACTAGAPSPSLPNTMPSCPSATQLRLADAGSAWSSKRVWPLNGHRVVLLSERIETKINLQPSCHLPGYNPLKSIIPVLQTLILHKENTGNVLCSGCTNCRLFLSFGRFCLPLLSLDCIFSNFPGLIKQYITKYSVSFP